MSVLYLWWVLYVFCIYFLMLLVLSLEALSWPSAEIFSSYCQQLRNTDFESIILNKSPPSLIPGAFAYPRRCSSQTGVDNLPALRLAMMSPWISLAYVN